MTDRATLFHEAAHAIAAVMLGIDVRQVQVHPQGTVTRAHAAGSCETRRQDIDADPAHALYYVLAGTAAEERLSGRPSTRSATDRAEAARLAATICNCTDTHDPRVLARLASAEAVAVAMAMMHDPIIWNAITLVAKALGQRSTLSGRDVQLLLREAKR